MIRVIDFLIDIINGVWSGFPICCVRFYSYHIYKNRPFEDYPKDPICVWYVRCEKCIKEGRYVKNIRKGSITPIKYKLIVKAMKNKNPS